MDIINFFYLLVALIYGLLLFLRPRIATYILIFLCVFQFSWFTRYFGASDYLGRILYLIAMLLAARIMMDFLTRKILIRKNDKMTHTMLIFILGIAALTILSNLYNGESMILGFYAMRYYFVMTTLFFSIYYYSGLKFSVESFIKGVVIIGFLQIPFAIIQFVLAGRGSYRTLDSVTGTFAGYPSLVLLTILSIGLLLNYKLETKKDLFKFNSYHFIFPLIIPLILSQSRVGTALVLFIILFVFIRASIRKEFKIKKIKSALIMSTLVLSIGFLFYNFFWSPSYDLESQFSIDNVIYENMIEPTVRGKGVTYDMGRALAVYEASKLILKNPITIMIGRGGGSTSEANLLGMHGRYFFKAGPLVGVGRSQVSKVIAEYGIIGVFLFLFLFVYAGKNVNRIRGSKEALRSSYTIILASFSLLSFYMQLFESPLSALILSFFFAFVQYELKKSTEINKSF